MLTADGVGTSQRLGPAEQTTEQRARWLDFHRREHKAVWWEYFRLSARSAEELLDERAAVSGLTFDGAVGGTAKAPVHRYHFPTQDTHLRGGEELRSAGGERFGKVVAISLENSDHASRGCFGISRLDSWSSCSAELGSLTFRSNSRPSSSW
jgi:hypothetical protein